MNKRIFLVVIDSFGIGAAPDAGDYGDKGASTIGSICRNVERVDWPFLLKLGLGNCAQLVAPPLAACPPVSAPQAIVTALAEKSAGKDTITGHWEIAGLTLSRPFTTFPSAYPSFPSSLMQELSRQSGHRFIGNCAASGTEIIERLGEQHMAEGKPICYTSSDSVLQLAAHEQVIPLEQLYRLCEIARRVGDDYNIGRVIARPFVGSPGNFRRTAGRHDYSIALPGKTLFDHLRQAGVKTVAVGKTGDIFNNNAIDTSYPDKGNPACLERMRQLVEQSVSAPEFIFTNLIDTDMLFGHRRDATGYHKAVAGIDRQLEALCQRFNNNDLLIITADHGCDPAFAGSDHTREFVPALICGGREGRGISGGVRPPGSTFADIAATVAAAFDCAPFSEGRNLLVDQG